MSFEDNEEHIINNILSCLNEETEVLRQQIVNKRKLIFDGLRIDEYKRIVVREDNEIELTYTEFEILLLLAYKWKLAKKKYRKQFVNLKMPFLWQSKNECFLIMTFCGHSFV